MVLNIDWDGLEVIFGGPGIWFGIRFVSGFNP